MVVRPDELENYDSVVERAAADRIRVIDAYVRAHPGNRTFKFPVYGNYGAEDTDVRDAVAKAYRDAGWSVLMSGWYELVLTRDRGSGNGVPNELPQSTYVALWYRAWARWRDFFQVMRARP